MRWIERAPRALLLASALSIAAQAARAQAWPLGTFTPTGDSPPTCPPGYTCTGFDVVCPNVTATGHGWIAVRAHAGTPRGVVVFFTGGEGTGFWTSQQPETYAMAESLRALGFTIAQVAWQTPWLESSPGNDAGIAHLACRPATVIRRIHDDVYLPLGVTPPHPGDAGFCVTGNSGGSSQVAYALSHYGLDSIIDVAIPTGGPPHAALAKSLLNTPGEEPYWYPPSTREFIDHGFGFFDGTGPGLQQDPSFLPRWLEESAATGGNDYVHPTTRVHIVFGDQDAQMQVVGGDYVDRLRAAGTPMLTEEIAAATPHGVYSTPEGRAAVTAAILRTLGPGVSAYCFGDGSATACPCGNASSAGNGEGCLNSFGNGGHLTLMGSASVAADSVTLLGTRMPNASALYFQGTTRINAGAGAVFGDGLRCAGGTVIRLGTKTNASGSSRYPATGDAHVSVRGMVVAGNVRTYQCWYRNPAAFCSAAVFNLTNALEIAWQP